jgi:hypothetical protein
LGGTGFSAQGEQAGKRVALTGIKTGVLEVSSKKIPFFFHFFSKTCKEAEQLIKNRNQKSNLASGLFSDAICRQFFVGQTAAYGRRVSAV